MQSSALFSIRTYAFFAAIIGTVQDYRCVLFAKVQFGINNVPCILFGLCLLKSLSHLNEMNISAMAVCVVATE